MRLIDADKLSEKMYEEAMLKDSDLQKWDSGCWIRYKLFENVMSGMPTIDPRPQWIPVSEQLPKVGQKVLASTNKTCFTQVFKGTSGASNSSWWWEKNTIKHIFAWCPLPEPWKAESEEA